MRLQVILQGPRHFRFCQDSLIALLSTFHELRHAESEPKRPAHVPPRWIGDLGAALPWKVILQYKFKRCNHININEELSYRSLLKHVAKTAPGSRFGVLLDSRVVIGCKRQGSFE